VQSPSDVSNDAYPEDANLTLGGNNVRCPARLAARPHALRPCARQPRGCHHKWLWPFVMLRATPQFFAQPRPCLRPACPPGHQACTWITVS
jgi:hypothetical protein